MSATSRCCWRAAATSCSPSARPARTITVRSPKGCWSATRCAARGITPASACAPARRCARRPSAPIACWSVEQRDGKVFVSEKRRGAGEARPREPQRQRAGHDRDRRRRRGRLRGRRDAAARAATRAASSMLSADDAAPVDRPNLSKDYLAGTAPEEWIPLRGAEFYAEQRHRPAARRARRRASTRARARWRCADGSERRLRRAAARDRRRAGPAADSRAPTCRTSTPCARSPTAARSSARPRRRKRAVVIGASFIGLEVAASLRARGHRGPRRRAGDAAAGARPGAGARRLRPRACTRSTASSSTSGTRWPRIDGERRSR